uniref:Caveolin n=1 Tax=Apteryx owenii TaxID=8824 RepID=A0A8B9PI34_APTOW
RLTLKPKKDMMIAYNDGCIVLLRQQLGSLGSLNQVSSIGLQQTRETGHRSLLGFEDVIAEPELTHSFDKVWICSHALFELSKYLIYKLVTLVLAIPLALVAGIIFAVLSCLHIWIVVPFVKTCLMVLPSVQTVWKSLTDVFIVPVFQSIGRCFAMVNIRLDQE